MNVKQIAIITPVPEIIDTIIQGSILRQAVEKDRVQFHILNLRDYAEGNYRQIDDEPYGGGAGMVLLPKPLFRAMDRALDIIRSGNPAAEPRVLLPSPQGVTWTQKVAEVEREFDDFVFICGHYKGIDERVIEKYVTKEYSLGDYVTSSGELPAMIMIDSIVRLIPGVLNTLDSALTDSHSDPLLDAPFYTRPREIEGMSVPDVLLSGHHGKIEAWRKKQRENRTRQRRPDLWERFLESPSDNDD